MYKKISIILIAALALMAASCDLEELPKSQVSRQAVFSTESGLQMYTNSFYNVFGAYPNQRASISYYVTGSYSRYLMNTYTADDQGSWSWTTLRNINYFLAHIDESPVSETVKNNYKGIARFFRAQWYFGMMQTYGDLPWIDEPLDVDDERLYGSRDPRTEIVDHILEDINFAIDNITTRKDDACGTITSSVAAALKSRICLWEGTYRKYHTEAGLQSTADQWLEECVSACEYVKESGYSLHTSGGVKNSYHELFVTTDPYSEEVLYAVTFDSSLGIMHAGNRGLETLGYGAGFSLTRSFVNTYLMLDGSCYTDKADYKTEFFTEECQNRDYRLDQTVRTPSFTRITNGEVVSTPPDFTVTWTGYQTRKWLLDDTYYDGVDACTNNVIKYRYAEVLLNYAEAKAELGTLTDDDWANTIGALRARSGITGGLTTKPTRVDPYMQERFFPEITDPCIMEIRRERAIELCMEGFAWHDIQRWKVGELATKKWDGIYIPELDTEYDMNQDGVSDVLFTTDESKMQEETEYIKVFVGDQYSDGSISNTSLDEDGHTLLYLKNVTDQFHWDDRLYLNPISTTDLVLNPNLGQNPGW